MKKSVLSLSSRMILFGMLIVLGAVLVTREVKSFNPQPDPPGAFGLMSLSETQSLRANVVHLHGDGPARGGATPPDDSVPVEVHVLSLGGEVIGSARLMLQLGQGGFVDLDGAQLMREHPELFGTDTRAQVRVEVHPRDPVGRRGGINPCVFPATVELFDNETGQTMVVLENPVGIGKLSGISPTPF